MGAKVMVCLTARLLVISVKENLMTVGEACLPLKTCLPYYEKVRQCCACLMGSV